MSLTTRVLIGLVAGLGLGVLVASSGSPALLSAAESVEPLGTLFINAIRMTVIPLVVGSLVVGVASAPDARSIGRIGGRAVLLFVVVLVAAAAFTALVAPPGPAGLHRRRATQPGPRGAPRRARRTRHPRADAVGAGDRSGRRSPTDSPGGRRGVVPGLPHRALQ